MSTGEAISVVVATRNRPAQLRDCLVALAAGTAAGDEVIVVDSCSSSPATDQVARSLGARLLRCERPGASLARNTGWRAAAHDVVAFVDDDVRVSPGWAHAVRAAAAAHPDRAFFTGRIGLLAEEQGGERPVALFDEEVAFDIDGAAVDGFGHGANLVVRRPALDAVGGYDEALGPGTTHPSAEDLDLVDRLVGAGFTGRYQPEMVAVHVQWRGRPQLLRLEWGYGVGQGARLARLRRADRTRYRALRRVVWRQAGLEAAVQAARQRYEFGVLCTVVRLAGTAVGTMTSPEPRLLGPGVRPAASAR